MNFGALFPHTGVIKRNAVTSNICGAEVKGGLFMDPDYQKYLRYKASFQDDFFHCGSDLNPHVFVDFVLMDGKQTSLAKVKLSKRYRDCGEYNGNAITFHKKKEVPLQEFNARLRYRYPSYLATLAKDAEVDILLPTLKKEGAPLPIYLTRQLLGDALHFVQQVNFINLLYPNKTSFPKNARDLSINTF